MTETAVEPLDVTRATAVLKKAEDHGMIEKGSIPERDTDKIVEAERLIAMAQQAEVIVRQIGEENMPAWPAARDILFEANVTLGITKPPQQVDPPPPPPAVEQPTLDPDVTRCSAVDKATGMQCDLGVGHEGMHHAAGFSWDDFLDQSTMRASAAPDPAPVPAQAPAPPSSPTAVVSPPAPPAPPAPEPPAAPSKPQTRKQQIEALPPMEDEMDAGQTWLDAHDQPWIIDAYGGGPQVAVHSATTGESTIAPRGFLKRRADAPPPSSPPAPASAPAPEPPASSAPPPPTPPPPALEQAAEHATDPAVVVTHGATPPAAQEQETAGQQQRHETQQLAIPEQDDEGDDAYANVLAQTAEDYTPRHMPAPMDLEHPPTSMPDDLTAVEELEQRRLHSQFNALASRARYLQGLEAARARACERVYKYNLRGAMKEARRSLGKDASVTEVEQEALTTHEILQTWLDRRVRHAERSEAWKVFLANYSEDVSVLSRDWTMRSGEERGS